MIVILEMKYYHIKFSKKVYNYVEKRNPVNTFCEDDYWNLLEISEYEEQYLNFDHLAFEDQPQENHKQTNISDVVESQHKRKMKYTKRRINDDKYQRRLLEFHLQRKNQKRVITLQRKTDQTLKKFLHSRKSEKEEEYDEIYFNENNNIDIDDLCFFCGYYCKCSL